MPLRRLAQPFCLLCLTWCITSLQLSSAAKEIVLPDYSIYLKKNDLLNKVEELVEAHPDIMKLEIRHAQDSDYTADLQVVTVELGGLSPSHSTKARLLIDFGEHGREYITSEVGLRFLQVLADPKQLEAMVGPGRRLERLRALLQHVAMKILPMENTHGRDLVEAGELCERKNGRGVDTNRNWDIDWGKKEKDYDPKEEYPGRAPHSEPEVQILLTLAKEFQPHTWLNVHSGMYALFTPYDHKASVPNKTDAKAALRMLQRIQELVCKMCVVGSGGKSVGYLAHGTGTDYMYEKLGVPMSFTWEIYGDNNASFEDCFRMFNPLGKKEFQQVVNLWVKALLHLIELLPTHPATWPAFRHEPLAKGDGAPTGSDAIPVPAEAAAAPAAETAETAPAAAPAAEAEATAPAEGPAAEAAADQQQQQKEQRQQPQQEQQKQQRAADGGQEQKSAGLTTVPAVTVEDEDGLQKENGQGKQRQQGTSRGENFDEQVQIARVDGGGAGSSAGWDAWRSRRPVPLLLALGGMGVLLYVVTRPSPHTKVVHRRTL